MRLKSEKEALVELQLPDMPMEELTESYRKQNKSWNNILYTRR